VKGELWMNLRLEWKKMPNDRYNNRTCILLLSAKKGASIEKEVGHEINEAPV
jgi:hypothetical protein